MFFNFFRKKPAESEEIRFSELGKWLDESATAKAINEEFMSKITGHFFRLNESLAKMENALKVLKAANLENRKVDGKVKEIVLQNRNVYAEHVLRLIAGIKKETEKKPSSLDEIENFVSAASENIDNFSKQSFRAFHITSELIGRELEAVVECIFTTSNCIKKIKEIDKEKIKAVILIKECMKDVEEKENVLNEISANASELQKEKEKIEKRLADAEKENEKIKTSDKWKRKQELASELESLNCELNANSLAAKSLFFSLEKAIKKWAWKEKNNRVLLYLENSLEALKKDKNFGIIDILALIKEDVARDKLELDGKRKGQLLNSISSITKESLAAFIEEENQIINKIDRCKQELLKYNIEFADISRISNQRNDLFLEMTKLEKRKQGVQQEILEKKREIENIMKTISNARLL